MPEDRVDISYRMFHDVPRLFVATYGGVTYLFDGSFDDAADEYPDRFEVFALPTLGEADLAGSWAGLRGRAIAHLGSVAVDDVVFDPTRRRSIDVAALRRLTERSGNERSGQASPTLRRVV